MAVHSRTIAFIGNFGMWHRGTLGYRTLPMARELIALGHRALVISPPWDSPAEFAGVATEWGVPVHRVETPRRRPGFRDLIVTTFRIATILIRERPDAVVAVKPIGYAGLFSILLRCAPTVRVVVDADDWEGRRGWSDLASLPRLQRTAVRIQEQLSLRCANHVMVASRELNRLANSVGVPNARISYLPNASWPGLAAWPRLESDIVPDVDVIVYSRQFEFDHTRFVALVSQLAARKSDLSLRVLGASLGDESTSLAQALVRSGHRDRVEFAGWVERESIAGNLRRGRIVLALFDDTRVNRARCSVKLLDMMLAECAIVAEDVGEVGHFLKDGATALLVSPGDGSRLADAILTLLQDDVRARRLGSAAARAAREQFTWECQRDDLVDAILPNSRFPS